MQSDRPKDRFHRVADLVTTILAKHDNPRPVGPDDELGKLGLTSIDMVELMLSVEGEFDIMIPPNDITTENFRSVAAVDRLVERLGGGSKDGNAEAA